MIFSGAALRWKMAVLVALSMAATVARAASDASPVAAIADRRLTITTPLGNGVLPLYVSPNWNKPQPEVTRALIIVHGAARNAVDYNHTGEIDRRSGL